MPKTEQKPNKTVENLAKKRDIIEVMGRPRKAVTKYARNPRLRNGALRANLRKKVIASQDTCALCGRSVDKTLPFTDPLAPEIDEIIPISRGGSAYDLDNLQLVHRICNQKKGNKMEGDSDLKSVENPIPNSRSW